MSEGVASRSCLSAYLNEIAKYPLLTAAEELRLAQQMSDGRRAAERLATLDPRMMGQPQRCSLAQIANRLGVTQERARQLEYRALRRIRTDTHAREVLAGFAPE